MGPDRTIASHSRRFNAFRLIVFLSPGVRASSIHEDVVEICSTTWRELFDIERIHSSVARVFFFFFFLLLLELKGFYIQHARKYAKFVFGIRENMQIT